MHQFDPPEGFLNNIQLGAIIVGVVGVIIAFIGAILDVDHFFHIYLVAFIFWLELSLGCLAVLMIPNLVPARWSLSVERIAAAGARTLPLMAILFIPLLFGFDRLFPWLEEATAGIPTSELDNFGLYLAEPFFILRAVIYFAIWIVLSWTLTNLSYQRDTSDDEGLVRRSHFLSIVGAILFFLTTTFAAFDWVMAIEDEWFSSISGWLAVSRQGLAAMAFFIVILALFWRFVPLERVLKQSVIGDLGAIQLGSLIAWAYLAFIQYLVIWSGNVSSKTVWYAERTEGSWAGLAVLIIVVHAVVLIAMIIPGVKRIWNILVSLAAVLLVMRLIDIYWTVMPTFRGDFVLEWWDIGLVIGMGGLWIGLFVWSLKAHSLLPLNRSTLRLNEQEEESYEPAH